VIRRSVGLAYPHFQESIRNTICLYAFLVLVGISRKNKKILEIFGTYQNIATFAAENSRIPEYRAGLQIRREGFRNPVSRRNAGPL
jgi:hypothetical protein